MRRKKHLEVSEDLYKRLKLYAVRNDRKISHLGDEILQAFLEEKEAHIERKEDG